MFTALRIMTQHGSASSAAHSSGTWLRWGLSLLWGGVAEARFKIRVGFSFLVVC